MSVTFGIPKLALRREAIRALIDAGIEPSPENIVDYNERDKSAPLYEYFKSKKPAEWSRLGKCEAARRILHHTPKEYVIGGAKIEARYVEYVRDEDGKDRWASMDSILADPHLRDSYMEQVNSLLEQAQEKMKRLRVLMMGAP